MPIKVTDKKYIEERPLDNSLLIVEDSPSGNPSWRLAKGVYYSFMNRWVNITSIIGGSQNLEDVLLTGNDGGGIEVENIANPTSAQSAATKDYVDTAVASANPVGSIPYSKCCKNIC
jgi:hypothetical protein